MKTFSIKINCGNGDYLKIEGTRQGVMGFLTRLVGPEGNMKSILDILSGEK